MFNERGMLFALLPSEPVLDNIVSQCFHVTAKLDIPGAPCRGPKMTASFTRARIFRIPIESTISLQRYKIKHA